MSFLELVKTAFFNQDNKVRTDAEQGLLRFRDTQLDDFFINCSQSLNNNQLDPSVRQAAGTLLKRCTTSYSPQGVQYWLLIKQESKSFVKNTLLTNLIATDPSIKRASSNVIIQKIQNSLKCISEICAVELPRKEWPDIISNLVNNTNNEQIEIKKAAMMTLGYICEALQRVAKNTIESSEMEKILYGICLGLKLEEPNEEIRLIAIKALQDSLLFMDTQYQNKIIRDLVANLLLQNVTCENEKIKTAALQCLIDFSKQLYLFLDEYLQGIMVATIQMINCKNKDISVLSMEVWYAIATELKEKKGPANQLTVCANQGLLVAILENLLINEEEEEEDVEQELSPQESAYKAAGAICDAVGNSCHQFFTQFIEKLLYDKDWQKRKAALLGFGALVENRNNQQVKQFSFSAIATLMNTLKDENRQVQKTSVRVLCKIAEHYPEVFIQHPNAVDINQMILDHFSLKPQIAKHLLNLINYVTELLPKYPQSPLNQQINKILQYLANSTNRPDLDKSDTQFINIAWVGILQLMYCIQDGQQIIQYLEEFQKQFVTVSQQNNWKREVLQSGLLSVMHACIMNMINKILKLDEAKLLELFNLIIGFFQHIQDVTSDGLYLVSGIAQYQKKNFTPQLQQLLPYLDHSLKKINETETFRATIYCLADIARSIQNDFTPYLSILDYLINCIQNQQIDREQKIHLFVCIGDIILSTGKASINSFQSIIGILKIGFASAVKFSQSNDSSLLDYADRFKEVLIQSYTCILHAYNDSYTPFGPLFDTLPMLNEFLIHVCKPELHPTVVKYLEFVRISLNCLMDAITFYRSYQGQEEAMKQFATSPIVMQLINILKKYQSNQENQSALIYAKDILSQFGIAVPLN